MNKAIFYIIGLVVAFVIVANVAYYGHKETHNVKISDKERITEITDNGKSSKGYYLIYTDKGTFKLEDDAFYLNFRSSDWYGKLHKDSTYTIHTVGYRSGWTSSYPNIVKID